MFFNYSILRSSVRFYVCKSSKKCVTLNNNFTTKEIIVPKRIPRESTDILKALSSTVKCDSTAPHYKYHDDPYLIPMSNIGKRTFALAQEAGRKSAFWIRQQHSELFEQELSEPPIKAYTPHTVFNENTQVSEEVLKDFIANFQISDSISVYKILKERNISISKETQQSLLEFLCFYNSQDPLGEEWIEERWFRQENKTKERQRKTWKDNEIAENLFCSFESPDSAAYNALIQGMTKYFQIDRAWKLYEEMQQKNIPLSIESYNSFIRVSNFLRESNDMRWKLVVNLLTSMNSENLQPNIGTLNAVLETLYSMSASRHTNTYAVKTLVEFKQLGIEPSLGSWYFILKIFYKERGPNSGILYEIMEKIKNTEFEIQDVKDTFFFLTAMEICRNYLQDVNLAKSVDELLHYGNNYNLIGDSFKESVYYRHYLILLCSADSLDNLMVYYNKLVPNIYIPEPSVMAEILKAIDINGSIDLVPKIWSDMVMFDHTDRESLLELLLDIIVKNKTHKESVLNNKFVEVAWYIWKKIEEQNEEKTNKLSFTGTMLGNMMIIFLRGNDFIKSCQIMSKLNEDQHNFVGVPKIEALQLFVEQCVIENQPSNAIVTVEYCVNMGFSEALNLAKSISKSFNLDESHISKLTSIIGTDFITVDSSDK